MVIFENVLSAFKLYISLKKILWKPPFDHLANQSSLCCVCSFFSHKCAFMYTDSITHGIWLESFLLQAEVFDPTDIQMFSEFSLFSSVYKSKKSGKGKIIWVITVLNYYRKAFEFFINSAFNFSFKLPAS